MSPTLRNAFDLNFQLTLPTWPPYSIILLGCRELQSGLLPAGMLTSVLKEVEGEGPSEPFCSGLSLCKAGLSVLLTSFIIIIKAGLVLC